MTPPPNRNYLHQIIGRTAIKRLPLSIHGHGLSHWNQNKFLLSSWTHILLNLTSYLPTPQNLCDFTAYESHSNLQFTSSSLSRSLYRSGMQHYFECRQRSLFPETVGLNRSLQHRYRENLPYHSWVCLLNKKLNFILFTGLGIFSQWFVMGKNDTPKPDFARLKACHRMYFPVSSLHLVFCGSHKTGRIMGYAMKQKYLIPAAEWRQETPKIQFP